jgi:TatD DNase family protein
MPEITPDKFINIHTHKDNAFTDEIALVNIFAQDFSEFQFRQTSYYSVGIHPWHIEKIDVKASIEQVRIAAGSKQVLAIGECGLDRAISTPLDYQTEIFIEQLKIAEEYNKPVVIHCVRAYPEIISLRNKYKSRLPWIMHGFTGHEQVARQLIEKNCYLAFGKFLFYREAKAPVMFPGLPIDHVFLESDEDNIPVEQVYIRASELKGLPLEELKDKFVQNFNKVFGWKN